MADGKYSSCNHFIHPYPLIYTHRFVLKLYLISIQSGMCWVREIVGVYAGCEEKRCRNGTSCGAG